jgi:alkylation response protein AidB-like acyl-CoA dehydrogenase
MQRFPWWTDAQVKLAGEVKTFVEQMIPTANEYAYRRKFPVAVMKEIAKKGYFGAMIPQKYGGRFEDWGVTGACIIDEEIARAGVTSGALTSTMVGGIHQILHFGTEEQRQRWLPSLAKGERLSAITITEPFVGSDAAAIRTRARLEGDHYVLNGKKRFIGGAGTADQYMAYVRTSDRAEDKAAYRHLTAMVVEKGTPGFTMERVADLVTFDGNQVGYLNFDNATVPASNRIGQEGDGWKVMTSGLNAERVISSSQWVGWMRESIRYSVYHMKRRIQFGQPTIDISVNQLKVGEMISKLLMSRLITYYTAYLIDQGQETPLESALAKLFDADASMEIAQEAVECMGGDGLSHCYPPSRMLRDSKLAQITAGTQEINKLVIFRQAMKLLDKEFMVPHYEFNEELNVPLPSNKIPVKQKGSEGILKVMAEYYRVQPGLHMSREELLLSLDMTDGEMDKVLLSLEEEGLVDLYRDKKGIIVLARSTYDGLAKVHAPEYYRSFPLWVDPANLF